MRIINNTGNTVHVADIDFSIPYDDGKTFYINPELLRKSRSLRSVIITSMTIAEYDPSERIENSVYYMKTKYASVLPSQLIPDREPSKKPKEPTLPTPEKPEKITVANRMDLLINGMFYDAGGYSKVNRAFTQKLHERGFNIRVEPKKSINHLKEEELKLFVQLERNKIDRYHIRIDSVIPTFADAMTGRYKILYTTVESYTVPPQFVECCNIYDEIWITSPWGKSILEKYVKKPIYVMPAGIDPEYYNETGEKFDLQPNAKSFVFISVFGWSYRKGYDVLLKAFFDEFSDDDDVTLLLVTRYQTGNSLAQRNKIKNDIGAIMAQFPNKNLPHVVRYSDVIAEADMPKLYRSANAFALFSRGEGSNLCAVEASLCGLPVLMTNVSGQQMYLRPDNAYCVEMDNLITIQPGQLNIHYWDNQKFPALTSDTVHAQARRVMREVYESYQNNNFSEPKAKNKRLQHLILSNYTWDHTANAMALRLGEIQENLRSKS